MKFWKSFFQLEPVQVILLSCLFALTASLGFFLCLQTNLVWGYLLTSFLYLFVSLGLYYFFGKWVEVITLTFITILIIQFGFREEMSELQSIQKETNQIHPTNIPKKGDPFLNLAGYDFATNWHFSKSILHKSTDTKGRDNSHTNHYALVPLINSEHPEEPIRFVYVANDFFLYHQWKKENVFPNFAKIQKETADLEVVRKEWVNRNPDLKMEKIFWLSLYESKENWIESKSSFLLFLTWFLPGIWSFVGLFWGIRLVFLTLISQFRS